MHEPTLPTALARYESVSLHETILIAGSWKQAFGSAASAHAFSTPTDCQPRNAAPWNINHQLNGDGLRQVVVLSTVVIPYLQLCESMLGLSIAHHYSAELLINGLVLITSFWPFVHQNRFWGTALEADYILGSAEHIQTRRHADPNPVVVKTPRADSYTLMNFLYRSP